jgi:hypothetical protein
MKKLLLIILPTLLVSSVKAQIVFDLADSKTKTETIDIDKSPVIVFKSLVQWQKPKYEYSFEVEMKENEIPPIPLQKKDTSKGLEAYHVPDEDTLEFGKAYVAFIKAKNESEIPKLYDKLEKEMTKLDKQKYPECLARGTSVLEASVFSKQLSFTLRNNQEITVTVTRKFKTATGKDTSVTWVRIYKTPEKTPWHILYGFTWVPNWMNPVSQFYCAGDSANGYVITRMNNQNKYFFKNVSPTLMIGWTPMKKYSFSSDPFIKALFSNHAFQFGLTGGLSMNFASETGSITGLFAPSIVFADNISLSFGACLTQKQILKGKYKEGDVVHENLDFDQLHEKQYMGEWFISMSIRFEKNPFEKAKSDK